MQVSSSSSSSVLIPSLQWRAPSLNSSTSNCCCTQFLRYDRSRSRSSGGGSQVFSLYSIRLANPSPPFASSFLSPFKARTFHTGPTGRRKTKLRIVAAVFERFTERAIKSVIFSQREARALGRNMVFTQHLLLGLIVEEEQHRHLHPKSHGFLGSGISINQAREAVHAIWHHHSQSQTSASAEVDPSSRAASASATDVPFSISTKRVLEAALEYSRARAHNFIALPLVYSPLMMEVLVRSSKGTFLSSILYFLCSKCSVEHTISKLGRNNYDVPILVYYA
ncbi:hypothetical protein PS2_044790 [Malus domestica]